MVNERLVELFVVTERRDGAIFKTKSVGEIWVEDGIQPHSDEIFAPLSTERAKQLLDAGEPTIRPVNR